jgi:hypothetical protein
MALRLFPKHTGVWEGAYTRIDPQGNVIDKWRSRLTLRLDGDIWTQTNEYIWDDGRREFHDFGASRFDENGVLHFDNYRIFGKSWETGDNIFLWWTYKDQAGSKLYEIITLLGPGHRMRTWQHSLDGRFDGLTMIEERQVMTQEELEAREAVKSALSK